MNTDLYKNYRHLNAGAFANMVRILSHGKTKETGCFVILDTDFVLNNPLIASLGIDSYKYDPDYYFKIANEAGFSAIMGNIGVIENIALNHPAGIPLILRINSGNMLHPEKIALTKALNSSIKDALRVGANAICFTVYVSSDRSYEMMEDLRDIILEAHENGLPVIVETLPKGGFISRLNETSLDVVALAVRLACELGADIIKSPYPSENIENPKAKKAYEEAFLKISDDIVRLDHLSEAAFSLKRILGLSLSEIDENKTLEDIKNLLSSKVQGMFVGQTAMKAGMADELMKMLLMANESKTMPLFEK